MTCDNPLEELPVTPDPTAIEEAVRDTARHIMPRRAFRDALDTHVRQTVAELAATPTFESEGRAARSVVPVEQTRVETNAQARIPHTNAADRQAPYHPAHSFGRRRFLIGAAGAVAASAIVALRERPVSYPHTVATQLAQSVFLTAAVAAAPSTTTATANAQPGNLDFSSGLAGWELWGNNPSGYTISLDTTVKARGSGSGSLAAAAPDPSGFGTLARSFLPDRYRGKRVRMIGTVKTDGVADWAGLWMRVDDAGGKALSFDNMQGRPIIGTRDWQDYAVVLDVPQEGARLFFGILLAGKGRVWLNEIRFDVVGTDVPTTDAQTWPAQMRNLGFESGTTAWFLAGSQPDAYRIGSDTAMVHEGRASAYLRAEGETHGGFGTLMQMVRPDGFAGTRVRMAGWARAEQVTDWAGLWMRVDGPDTGKSLGFDNMRDRPIIGTRDWTRYEIVLDVPTHATAIAFGVLLQGAGTVWLDDVQFAVVTADVPVTGSG